MYTMERDKPTGDIIIRHNDQLAYRFYRFKNEWIKTYYHMGFWWEGNYPGNFKTIKSIKQYFNITEGKETK